VIERPFALAQLVVPAAFAIGFTQYKTLAGHPQLLKYNLACCIVVLINRFWLLVFGEQVFHAKNFRDIVSGLLFVAARKLQLECD